MRFFPKTWVILLIRWGSGLQRLSRITQRFSTITQFWAFLLPKKSKFAQSGSKAVPKGQQPNLGVNAVIVTVRPIASCFSGVSHSALPLV